MRRHGPSELRNEAYFFLFTVPCLVLYTMFFVTPILLGFYYSLTNWNGIAPTFEFVGLKNFLFQLRDRSFHYSLKFTLTYALLVVPAAVLVSFFSALFLTTIRGRLQTIYKGFLFFPALLAPIVVSLIWKQIYTFALPWIGNALNLEFLKVSLMTNMKTLKGTIQFVHVWQAVALQTVLFVAGLQNIPDEIYDASRIDGAGFFQRLGYIIFPYIVPILNMVLILAAQAVPGAVRRGHGNDDGRPRFPHGVPVGVYLQEGLRDPPGGLRHLGLGDGVPHHDRHRDAPAESVEQEGREPAMRQEGKAVHAIGHLYLVLGVLLVLFPLYLLVVVSFKPLAASAANFIAFPTSLYLENFKKVLSLGLYVNSIKNSVIVVVVPLLFVTTLVPMVSFAIARNAKQKRYYRYLYRYVIASLFVPFNAIMIPIVILSSKLDMMNIPGLIILYVSLSFSQGTFLFVGYIRSLPAELDESAYMDGCSVPRLFASIIMPLCKPMIITIIILNSLWYWNDFMLPGGHPEQVEVLPDPGALPVHVQRPVQLPVQPRVRILPHGHDTAARRLPRGAEEGHRGTHQRRAEGIARARARAPGARRGEPPWHLLRLSRRQRRRRLA